MATPSSVNILIRNAVQNINLGTRMYRDAKHVKVSTFLQYEWPNKQ